MTVSKFDSRDLAETIGLEVHIELKTSSKMFCGCSATHFSVEPNTNTCPVCLGLPGALPIPNEKAVEWAIIIAQSLGCKINNRSKFDRKHYNYPDLPKGYQISQYDEPIGVNGTLTTSYGNVRIRRVHLEEDTGKLQHLTIEGRKVSLVDFNRSGVPLLEIVAEPDIHSGAQAKEYAQELQKIVRFLGFSDCDMEKGSMRLEANISWGLQLGYKVEVKNLNSFRFVDKAINFELSRQKSLLIKGELPRQETRGYSEGKNETFTQRFKETEADYRYFPEPDIPPMQFSDSYINGLSEKMPELPLSKEKRFVNIFGIKAEYSKILNADPGISFFSENCFVLAKQKNIDANTVAGIIVNQKISPEKFSEEEVILLAKKKRETKITGEKELSTIVDTAILQSTRATEDYRKGRKQALGVIIGKVMAISNGKADPVKVRELIEKKLKAM